MKAMQLHAAGTALRLAEIKDPVPGPGEVLLKVSACAVCRTDLHVIDGDLPDAKLPLVPGHEIVGTVIGRGPGADRFRLGDRVGVPWLGWTCGTCRFCLTGRENLCDRAKFTGYHRDGGYAELAVADQRFAFALPEAYSDEDAAPLLCAGLIGHRALRMAGDARKLGIYGFGAAAHIVAQVARYEGREIYAFVRPGDRDAATFAERVVRSVANLTRQDAVSFLDIAPLAGVETHVELYPLNQANQALDALRAGKVRGAAVLRP